MDSSTYQNTGNNKPRANILPQEKSLVGGKKTKKLPRSDEEKNRNQFSGSAAVFMSLFSESDEKSPSVTLTKTPNHHDIPSVTSDPKKSLDTTNAKNVNGKLAGNLTVLMEPKAGAISNKRQPKRKGDREKVMLTQLKTYRSFS